MRAVTFEERESILNCLFAFTLGAGIDQEPGHFREDHQACWIIGGESLRDSSVQELLGVIVQALVEKYKRWLRSLRSGPEKLLVLGVESIWHSEGCSHTWNSNTSGWMGA